MTIQQMFYVSLNIVFSFFCDFFRYIHRVVNCYSGYRNDHFCNKYEHRRNQLLFPQDGAVQQ